LLSNALKYSPAGGVVAIRLDLDEESAVLSVHDEGMGIPAEDQPRIFEKFFRAPEAAAAVGGTGLGLAVAREIVETHGGQMRVASEPGSGSTFWVVLPARALNAFAR
jgi:signal transduction histidine kinase